MATDLHVISRKYLRLGKQDAKRCSSLSDQALQRPLLWPRKWGQIPEQEKAETSAKRSPAFRSTRRNRWLMHKTREAPVKPAEEFTAAQRRRRRRSRIPEGSGEEGEDGPAQLRIELCPRSKHSAALPAATFLSCQSSNLRKALKKRRALDVKIFSISIVEKLAGGERPLG